jgi:hypothetical protein
MEFVQLRTPGEVPLDVCCKQAASVVESVK